MNAFSQILWIFYHVGVFMFFIDKMKADFLTCFKACRLILQLLCEVVDVVLTLFHPPLSQLTDIVDEKYY